MVETKCPKCGKLDFSNPSYMKRHHKLVHGETLKESVICAREGCNEETYNGKFCSRKCMGKHRRKHETTICYNSKCSEKVYNAKYCSRDCANKETWKDRENAAKRDEVRKKISEAKKGQTFDMPEEAKKKISRAMSGENHPLYGKTGEEHPKYGKLSGLKMQEVKETGHTVRSNWEKEIDLILYRSEFDYEYEPITFELNEELTYTPDFIVDNIVIEVKGWPNEISKKRAKIFMEERSEYAYIVVGNKVPCDIFIDWDNRQELISEIRKNI